MDDLKKQFNEFIKGKRFKVRNDYRLAEIKSIFGFKCLEIIGNFFRRHGIYNIRLFEKSF